MKRQSQNKNEFQREQYRFFIFTATPPPPSLVAGGGRGGAPGAASQDLSVALGLVKALVADSSRERFFFNTRYLYLSNTSNVFLFF